MNWRFVIQQYFYRALHAFKAILTTIHRLNLDKCLFIYFSGEFSIVRVDC